MKFTRHYSREEARALLPQVRQWLRQLADRRRVFDAAEERLEALRTPGADLGGQTVNAWVRSMPEIQEVLLEFHRREIQVKDLERGLIDFPSMRAGKEVFLCWESGEEDIEFWHDLDAGYAGREPI